MNGITDKVKRGAPALSCANASFGYDGHLVVRDLTFAVERGGYLCVVGENGSGKSTLLKGLLGLIPPLRGEVVLAPDLKKSATGYLSQAEAAKKDFPAGVSEIVLSGFAGQTGLRPFYTSREKALAEENMKRLEVGDLKKRCFRELSGGQQRRVLIARALCASRELLALDEPAAGLDPPSAAGLYELLAELNRAAGVTVIMVTHDREAALRHGKTVLHVAEGGAAFFGPAAAYARSAYARAFFAAETAAGTEVSERL